MTKEFDYKKHQQVLDSHALYQKVKKIAAKYGFSEYSRDASTHEGIDVELVHKDAYGDQVDTRFKITLEPFKCVAEKYEDGNGAKDDTMDVPSEHVIEEDFLAEVKSAAIDMVRFMRIEINKRKTEEELAEEFEDGDD